MSILRYIDPRTLLACQALLAIVFCLVFLAMNRASQQRRGSGLVALSFFLLMAHSILMGLRGEMNSTPAVAATYLLDLGAQLAMYEAIVKFTRERNFRRLLWVVSGVAMVVVMATIGSPMGAAPRIVAAALAGVMIRGFTAAALLERARSSNQRAALQTLAGIVLLVAAESLYRAVMTLSFGAPAHVLEANAIQTPGFVLSLLYMTSSGMLFLLLLSNEMVTNTRREAHVDSLTGVFNRRGIEVVLAMELGSMRGGDLLSLALIDIDNFKAINDSAGHAVGDSALKLVANRLAARMRRNDHIGRLGGDEFLLVLPGTGYIEALRIMERLTLEIAGLPRPGTALAFTVSAGITVALRGEAGAEPIERADRALYQAKRDGRGCCRVVLPNDGLLAHSISDVA